MRNHNTQYKTIACAICFAAILVRLRLAVKPLDIHRRSRDTNITLKIVPNGYLLVNASYASRWMSNRELPYSTFRRIGNANCIMQHEHAVMICHLRRAVISTTRRYDDNYMHDH